MSMLLHYSRSQTQTTPVWITSSISHGEGGSEDLTGGNADLHLEVHLEVCMLTPTREAIDAAMRYGREKLGLATLKPRQETAISNFTLGKDNITGSQ